MKACIVLSLVALSATALLVIAGCTAERQDRPAVVASTSMIAAIVEEIAGTSVDVTVIVPAGMCPGHFDIKPRQMEAIERADLFICHGWEPWLSKVAESTAEGVEVVRVEIEGNWMVPDLHVEAVRWIGGLLVILDPANEDRYEERALRYENQVLRELQATCTALSRFQGSGVICSELQADFLSWVGLDILGTYGRTEDLAPRTMEHLIEVGKRMAIRLVVDNLQSGPDIGRRIAEETGATHVVLTNFPVDGSYTKALRMNVKALEDALR